MCRQFEKPGRRADFDYPEMASEAVTKALTDAGAQYTAVEQAYVGYVYGEEIGTDQVRLTDEAAETDQIARTVTICVIYCIVVNLIGNTVHSIE